LFVKYLTVNMTAC